MAQLVTVRLLVDDDDQDRIEGGINEMLSLASEPIDPEAEQGYILASEIGRIDPAASELEDAATNGTVTHGDLGAVWFNWRRHPETGATEFWSDTEGWIPDESRATRIRPIGPARKPGALLWRETGQS